MSSLDGEEWAVLYAWVQCLNETRQTDVIPSDKTDVIPLDITVCRQ